MPMVLHCAGWPRWLNFKTLVGSISQRCQQMAIEDVKQAAQVWFDALADEPVYLGGLHLFLDGEVLDYSDCLESVGKVLQRVLDEEEYQEVLGDELRGRLLYLSYKAKESAGYTAEDDMEDVLVRAYELFEHPLISYDLQFYYLEPEKIPKGVHHHLDYALWKHSSYDSLDSFPAYLAELDYLDWEDRPIVGANDHASVHRVALSFLETSNEQEVKEVMVPFYKSFWRRVLFEG